MISLSECPICRCADLQLYLTCKDHTVSHETFQLQQCTACGFVLTNPRPAENELGRYYESENYISHAEDKSGLIHRIYRTARLFTVTWKYKIVQAHSLEKPQRLLDYGCGTGSFLRKCLDEEMSVTGIEPSHEARTHATRSTEATVHATIESVTGTFDVITLWHVLEHVPDLHDTLEKLKDRLKENGTMFIAVPNLQSPDAKKYQQNWAGYDVPRHLWHFSKDTMKRILDTHHLNVHAIVPMKLDAYYVSLLSEKYAGTTNALLSLTRGFFAGWNANRNARTSSNYSSLIYIIRK